MGRRGQSLTLSFIFKGSSLCLFRTPSLYVPLRRFSSPYSSGTITPQTPCLTSLLPLGSTHLFTHLLVYDFEMFFKDFMLVLICFLETETRVAYPSSIWGGPKLGKEYWHRPAGDLGLVFSSLKWGRDLQPSPAFKVHCGCEAWEEQGAGFETWSWSSVFAASWLIIISKFSFLRPYFLICPLGAHSSSAELIESWWWWIWKLCKQRKNI